MINLHDHCDLKPFRWGDPLFIRETVEQWKKMGLLGAEIHPLISWRGRIAWINWSRNKKDSGRRGKSS